MDSYRIKNLIQVKNRFFILFNVKTSASLFVKMCLLCFDGTAQSIFGVNEHGVLFGESNIYEHPKQRGCEFELYQGVSIEYDARGEIYTIIEYSNGKINGNYIRFDENGNIRLSGHYIDNQETGVWTYFRLGKVTLQVLKDTMPIARHDYAPKMQIVSYFDGEIIDTFSNGDLYQKAFYINGFIEGEYISYHEKKSIRSKGNFKNGKRIGEWSWYYPNGTIFSQATYSNDGIIKHYIEFNTEGKKSEKCIFNENGDLLQCTEY